MKRPPSLSRRGDFCRVLRHGAKIHTPLGTLLIAPAADAEAPARLGLAVSSRLGGAVERNRIKRRLRAAFRSAAPRGIDVVVRPSAACATLPFQDLEEIVRSETAAR